MIPAVRAVCIARTNLAGAVRLHQVVCEKGLGDGTEPTRSMRGSCANGGAGRWAWRQHHVLDPCLD
jgi:hypothetical protein